jgi:hypothetical protein
LRGAVRSRVKMRARAMSASGCGGVRCGAVRCPRAIAMGAAGAEWVDYATNRCEPRYSVRRGGADAGRWHRCECETRRACRRHARGVRAAVAGAAAARAFFRVCVSVCGHTGSIRRRAYVPWCTGRAAAAASFLCNAVNALVLQARRGAGLWDGRAAPSCAQWTLTRRDSADASLGDRCECEGQCARARVHCSVRSLAHENSRARTRNGHLRGRGCVCRPGRRRLI